MRSATAVDGGKGDSGGSVPCTAKAGATDRIRASAFKVDSVVRMGGTCGLGAQAGQGRAHGAAVGMWPVGDAAEQGHALHEGDELLRRIARTSSLAQRA